MGIDQYINTAIEPLRNIYTNQIFWLISLSVYVAIATTLAYFYFKKHDKHHTLILLNAYVLLYLIVEFLKRIVARVRPNGELFSFPSRHTVFAFFIAYTFPATKKWHKPVLYTWASLVAASRLILLEHWISDVIIGIGLGLLAGIGFKEFKKKIKQLNKI